MATHVISGSRGLYTNTGSLSIAGALRIAQDVVIRRPVPIGIDYGQIQSGGGLIEPRRSYEQFSQFAVPAIDSPVVGMFEYDNQAAALGAAFYLVGQTGRIYRVDSPTVLTPVAPAEKLALVPGTTSWSTAQTQTSSATNYIRSAQMNGNVYFCTKYGVYTFDGVTGTARPRQAGIGRCPDPLPGTAALPAVSITMPAFSGVGYRVLWGFRDANQNLILGPPSGRFVYYTGATPLPLGLQFTLPSAISADIFASSGRTYIYQIYRTAITAAGTAFASIPDPGDAMTLIYQGQTAATGINFFSDPTPDGFIKGPDLYTNANQEGIQNANTMPPACADIAAFKGAMLYANCSGITRSQITVIGSPDQWTIAGMTVVGQNVTVTVSGAPNLTLEGFVPSDFCLVEGNAILSLHPHGWPLAVNVRGNTGTSVSAGTLISVTSNTLTYHVQSSAGIPSAGTGGTVLFAAIGLNGGQWVACVNGSNGGFGSAMLSNGTFVTSPSVGLADATLTLLGGTPSQNITLIANAITQAFGRTTLDGKPLPLSVTNVGGVTDPPGVISVEAQNPGPLLAGTSTTTASVTTILANKSFGSLKFYPDCGTAPLVPVSDLSVARIYYSKTFQPEAVPLNSYFDIGDKGAPIRRIVATRDNVFIFKDDGVYRLAEDPNSGAKPSLYDPTLVLVNPNLVCTIDNQVFMLSTRGFFQLSNVGAKEFGLNIRDLSTMLIEAQTTSLPNICIPNERDQMIYFTLPGPKGSVWSLAYSLITHTWTQSSTLAMQAPATWPGLYYKGTLSSSLKSLHSGVILRHSNRDVSVTGAQVTAGDIFQEAVIDQNDNFLATNLVSDPNHGISPSGTIQEALNCLPPPGDRYYFDVTSASGSTITMSPISNTMGITPNVGDAIYQLGQTTQYWIINAVTGTAITVSPYGNTTNATPSTTGTTTFNSTPGACQLLRPLSIAVEWSGFNAGNDSKLKHWHGSAVFFDELCSQTDTFSIYSYTEIDQVPQTASWPPSGIVVHPVYAARILLPIRHQRSRRVHIGLTGGQALKFTVISGVAYEATEHSAERESE